MFKGRSAFRVLSISTLFTLLCLVLPVQAQQIPLEALVAPSTIISKNGKPVSFALHGFIEFKSLAEMFPYIETQTRRWKLDDAQRMKLAHDLLREGVESRVVSMVDERPLETLLTHTPEELRRALAAVDGQVPAGYAEAFLAVQEKWRHSVNCWSASSSMPGRVLSNWYPIAEGIQLYGATYDSTEHFWQAVKFHPDTSVSDARQLLALFMQQDWGPWLKRLDDDPQIYLLNAYAVEFLRANLTREKLQWFDQELTRHDLSPGDHLRQVQQRESPFRFSAAEDKGLFGDLADTLHLVYVFSTPDDPLRKSLADRHFDAVYLNDRRMGFISEEFRSLMLEIWHVKYLQMPRFRQVISSIPVEVRLEHFLNDGDSPDIPIPIYVGYLNEIRRLALEKP